MSDKLDHFVLEYDDESGLALLAMTEADGGRVADGAGLPYAVASGYEADSRTWESIESFDDVTRAKLRYEKACGRDYVPTGGKLYAARTSPTRLRAIGATSASPSPQPRRM